MNKIEKIIFIVGIGSGIIASIANLISGNWTLGVTQFLLAFLCTHTINHQINKIL